MLQIIEKEEERVSKEISKFESLLKTIRKRRYRIPHLEKFETLIQDCYEILNAELAKRLRDITSHVPPEIASRRIADLRLRIKSLFDVMYVALSNSFDVPREIYFLSDTFLDYHGVPMDYIIFISDEIAMFSFMDALESIGFHEWYPEFWGRMHERKFYFVQTVSEFNKRDASMDWPIILHEMAHIICDQMETSQRYFPEVSVRRALEIVYAAERQSFPEFLVTLAKKKLYVTEHLADLLVTRCFGAIYGWRFLKEYVSLKDAFEPGRSHPSPDKRLQKISSEVNNELQMPSSSRFLDQELQSFTGGLTTRVEGRSPDINVDAILTNVLGEVRNYSRYILTHKQVEQSIRESTWFRTLERGGRVEEKLNNKNFDQLLQQLQDDLLKGIPIILDPPALYFIATLEFSNLEKISRLESPTTKAARIRELIADCVRLYAIQHRLLTEVLPK